MSLKVVGAGLGRTGTLSLKHALERLTGGRCYHMVEVFARPEHIPAWHDAALGRMPDWKALFAGYEATVDWPSCAFWREISAAFPESHIILSTRDLDAWWTSAHATIFPSIESRRGTAWHDMVETLFDRTFTRQIENRDACLAAHRRHVERVRALAPRDRLLEWCPADGWEPLCRALGVAVPNEPFPHLNSTDEFWRVRGGTPGRASEEDERT